MAKQRVIVEISPSRVEVAVLRGNSPEGRCERFGRAEWPSPYTTAMAEVGAAVGRILSDLGVSGAPATVVFATPGSVTTMTSCPTSLGLAAGEQAAQLSLANVADFPMDDAPSDTCLLLTDRPAKGQPGEEAPVAQRHFLACADAEQRTQALAECLSEAGLSVDRLIPADAVAVADAAYLACQDHGDGGTGLTAIVWIGEHTTSLVVGTPGRLLLARTIAAGTENLVEVLCRPLRPREGAEGLPVTLQHTDARTMLLTVGVPTPEALIPGQPTLAGSSLLPHLQPILQRLGIEVKQSLRFGVPEGDRPTLRLRLAGPGAAIPGLGQAIERISGFPFAPAAITDTPDALDSSTGGLIAGLLRCHHLSISLLPAEVRRAAATRRVRKALVAGACVALAYVGYETADAQMRLTAERSRLSTLNSALQSSEAPLEVRRQAVASRGALTDAERRVRKAIDATPEWAATMLAVAAATPPEVRLSTLDMHRTSTEATLTLRGYIRLADAQGRRESATIIHDYVQALAATPLVLEVRLGNTQRTTISGYDVQTFDLTLTVVQLPGETGLRTAAHPAAPAAKEAP